MVEPALSALMYSFTWSVMRPMRTDMRITPTTTIKPYVICDSRFTMLSSAPAYARHGPAAASQLRASFCLRARRERLYLTVRRTWKVK